MLKQIMPYYDRYTAPYFQGIDHDVVLHGMPGGATSSSQEGAMRQGHIHLLPYMLRFLAGTRRIVRYHDVTPGSQITWNTAFLAVTSAFQRGGEEEVRHLLWIMEMEILDIAPADPAGMSLVRYALDDETFAYPVKVAEATGAATGVLEMAERDNSGHVGSPSTGDLWVMYVQPGDIVKKGEELFNITIMKQEKAVPAPMDGIVERVLKTADFKHDKKMVPVREGELLVVLGPVPKKCSGCHAPVKEEGFRFCPQCGASLV